MHYCSQFFRPKSHARPRSTEGSMFLCCEKTKGVKPHFHSQCNHVKIVHAHGDAVHARTQCHVIVLPVVIGGAVSQCGNGLHPCRDIRVAEVVHIYILFRPVRRENSFVVILPEDADAGPQIEVRVVFLCCEKTKGVKPKIHFFLTSCLVLKFLYFCRWKAECERTPCSSAVFFFLVGFRNCIKV